MFCRNNICKSAKKITQSATDELRAKGKERGLDFNAVEAVIAKEEFSLPTWMNNALLASGSLLLVIWVFNFVFFYAQPTHIYHVRTMFNQERVVNGIGWAYYGGGHIEPWKKAVSVQANVHEGTDIISSDDNRVSANLPPQNIVFLDNVDADVSASVRFRIPVDEVTFLIMAHEYRTPTNFLLTSLIPAFKETLQATASLMSAEEYFAGARTIFASEFENQMNEGIFQVRREEVQVRDNTQHSKSSANASKKEQEEYDNNNKTIFKVVKMKKDGIPLRKLQQFKNYGVSIIEARIPDMNPNDDFDERMKKKQQASADRAIARESRIQEEEQKLLAVARGDREVAERQAIWRADQIEQTTKAETDKQLALTQATKLKEQAEIDKKTAQLLLDKKQIDAKALIVMAQAEAKARKLKILADNGLKLKVEALIQMNKDNAVAFATRKVPNTVVYSGNSKGQLGANNDMETVVTSQMLKNLSALDLSMKVKN